MIGITEIFTFCVYRNELKIRTNFDICHCFPFTCNNTKTLTTYYKADKFREEYLINLFQTFYYE